MKILYHLYPVHNDAEYLEQYIELYKDIPWRADWKWDEEGAYSLWYMERTPDMKTEFLVHIDITICGDDVKSYHYDVSYKDLCYAFAKAYTKMLKKHGFMGYHRSEYMEDIQVRCLLFLKAYALDCLDVIALTDSEDIGEGECSSLEKEWELLMFDM